MTKGKKTYNKVFKGTLDVISSNRRVECRIHNGTLFDTTFSIEKLLENVCSSEKQGFKKKYIFLKQKNVDIFFLLTQKRACVWIFVNNNLKLGVQSLISQSKIFVCHVRNGREKSNINGGGWKPVVKT